MQDSATESVLPDFIRFLCTWLIICSINGIIDPFKYIDKLLFFDILNKVNLRGKVKILTGGIAREWF